MDTPNKPEVTLEGKDVVNLWLEGRDAWNRWVKKNPDANVDFGCIDFSKCRGTGKHLISFERYKFPNGGVSFVNAIFGEGCVSFKGATFGEGCVSFKGATFGDGYVWFVGAIFGVGDVLFNGANFGDGDISFIGATFGDGYVSFNSACFGDGYVSFNSACFGDGDVSFDDVTFGDGDVSFSGATFGGGSVSFNGASFGKGMKSFDTATFGTGNVTFYKAIFESGNVTFDKAMFGFGNVSFYRAKFGNGNFRFNNVNFGEGNVSFFGATFGVGSISFDKAAFGTGNVTFNKATFGGTFVSFDRADFGDGYTDFRVTHFGKGKLKLERINCKYISFELPMQKSDTPSPAIDLTTFTLRGAAIDGPLIMNNMEFNCIPDLRSTKLTHHVDMDGLKVNLVREKGSWKTCWHRYVKDKTAQSKLGRMKEIAEQFKHHHEALKFNALENQAKRWVNEPSFIKNVMDMLYSFVSDYGRSYVRPMIGLALSWLYFAMSYTLIAFIAAGKLPNLLHMLGFAVVNSLPFIPIGRSIRTKAEALYFSGSVDWVYGFITVQSIVSLILIFLIGLGLRNQFRL
ncbi:MAG: hypothetical protein HWE26_02005 [Alteromonadaceae bacterium]|nr:hypothetical protein [Alteromonadaceae bacterium]